MELTTLHVEILQAALTGGIWGLGTDDEYRQNRRSRAYLKAVEELIAAGYLERTTVKVTVPFEVIRLTKDRGTPLAQEQWDAGADERAYQAAIWTAKLNGDA